MKAPSQCWFIGLTHASFVCLMGYKLKGEYGIRLSLLYKGQLENLTKEETERQSKKKQRQDLYEEKYRQACIKYCKSNQQTLCLTSAELLAILKRHAREGDSPIGKTLGERRQQFDLRRDTIIREIEHTSRTWMEFLSKADDNNVVHRETTFTSTSSNTRITPTTYSDDDQDLADAILCLAQGSTRHVEHDSEDGHENDDDQDDFDENFVQI